MNRIELKLRELERDHHTVILSPPLEWGPEEFRDRHLTGEEDKKLKFDPRCPKCVADWARTGKEHAR